MVKSNSVAVQNYRLAQFIKIFDVTIFTGLCKCTFYTKTIAYIFGVTKTQ